MASLLGKRVHSFLRPQIRHLGTNVLVPPQKAPSWNHTPEDIRRQTQEYVDRVKREDNDLASVEGPTVQNFLERYAHYENVRIGQQSHLTFYQNVATDPELRNASSEAETILDRLSIEAGMREDMFRNVKKVYEDSKDADLDPETRRFLTKLYQGFKRNGLELSKEVRSQVEAVLKELLELSIQYNKNLGEQTEHLLLTKDQLEGLPDNVMSQFEVVGDKYKVTFKYPDIIPTLKYAKKAETRKLAFIRYQNIVPENAELLKKTVAKRLELAKLLGYESYADYVLEESMAKSVKTVMDFENGLLGKLQEKAREELAVLKKLKLEDYKAQGLDTNSDEAQNYYVWDHSYYNNKLLEQKYKVDEQKILEYFPLQSTIENMLKFYEKLFLLRFDEVTDPKAKSVWHEDVKQFAVWKTDTEKPEFIGWIYFDLHPREGKYGHAAAFGLWPGYLDSDNTKKRPVCALVCNFLKPTKTKPSLLKHSEVTTFFHELGHGIHDLVSETRYGRFHGATTSRDFVEAPSQMLEFWTWLAPELKRLLLHYVTGKPLEDDLIKSLVALKHVNGALANLRQLHFGLFDMAIHSTKDGKVDVDHEWNVLRENITMLALGVETKGYGSFGHMMGGYAAGYYGYLYLEVFAADLFYTLFKADPMNTVNGIRYRDTVLKVGGSREELDGLREVLGRDPNNKAFLEELGVQ